MGQHRSGQLKLPETRKYWVDVHWGIVSSHGEKVPLSPWLAILLEMMSHKYTGVEAP